MPGLELPDIHFPLRTPETIVCEDLEKKLSSEQKKFLISEFLTYPSLISQYSYDVGRLKDYRGQPIFMDVKLSSPLPFMKKAYKLSEEESKMMNDVLDFLIFYRLGEEASPHNQTGAPAFLVNRSSTQRAARLIIDTRFSNKFLAEPVSCHPTTILDPLRSLLSNCTYGSLLLKWFDWLIIILEGDKLETDELQFGFQAKSSTSMCTWAINTVIDHYNRLGRPIFACSMDLSKAFDMVSCAKLFPELLKRKISPLILRCLIHIYSNQMCNVKWGNIILQPFNVKNGVRQGAVSSPILFCVYINDLIVQLRNLKVGCQLNCIYL